MKEGFQNDYLGEKKVSKMKDFSSALIYPWLG